MPTPIRRSYPVYVSPVNIAQYLDVMLARFGIATDHDLAAMRPDQSLNGLAARILEGMESWLESQSADFVVVQGDTTSTMAAALAAFYRKIPVGHVEAGLRTGDLTQPFPEEINRVLTTRLAALHFAPTRRAEQQLLAEGVARESVFLTGNTAIDALLYTYIQTGKRPMARLLRSAARRGSQTRRCDCPPPREFWRRI